MSKKHVSSYVGTFRKSEAKKVAELLKASKMYNVKLRGRGHRYGHTRGGYAQDLPISKATSCAIYVTKKKQGGQ